MTVAAVPYRFVPKLLRVEYFGALRTIMHQGDLSAGADLKDFKEAAHLYGLGAFKDLK